MIASGMKHPNVVETYEYGMTNKGQPYLVMEFIDGPGLQQLIHNKSNDLFGDRRLGMIRQMADALAYVHVQVSFTAIFAPEILFVQKTSTW